MITSVINIVDSTIRSALTGISTNIFFYELPNSEILDKFSVTYEVNNSDNEGVFTDPALISYYNVQVKLNSKNKTEVINNSIYVRTGFKNLFGTQIFKTIVLNNEQLFWDDELKTYTNNLNYKIQY